MFDTSFETKMMLKSGAIKIIFKSHEPFRSYLMNFCGIPWHQKSTVIWLWCIRFCHRKSISILMNCTSLKSHYVWHQIYIFYCDGTAGRIVHAFLSWETKKVEEGVEGTVNVYRELNVTINSYYIIQWIHCWTVGRKYPNNSGWDSEVSLT